MIRTVRVLYKLFLVKICNLHLASFCKICGVNVRDFSVSDDIWLKVREHIKFGNTLCYNCFCDICREINLPSVWELKELK